MKSLSLIWYRRNILNGDQPSLHSCPHLTFTAGTIQSSTYDALDATVLEQEVGVQRFELWTSRSQTERATKLRHTPKWNGFVLLLPSASTFIEGISRDLAPVYYPPYGHSSSFCGTLLQGLSTTYVSHLPFLILYKYYNKIFIKNQLNNFAIFLLVATPTY